MSSKNHAKYQELSTGVETAGDPYVGSSYGGTAGGGGSEAHGPTIPLLAADHLFYLVRSGP